MIHVVNAENINSYQDETDHAFQLHHAHCLRCAHIFFLEVYCIYIKLQEKLDMDFKKERIGSNIVDLRSVSRDKPISASTDFDFTAQGLALLHAFFRITSSDDRKKIISLARQLSQPRG
jgi:hypothetical protein